MKKISALILSVLFLTLTLSSCSQSDLVVQNCYRERLDPCDKETNFVQIEIENQAYIVIELYPEIAPITVANFKKLVKEGFYDGLTFHRIISGFMIQGGDPEGTGMGGSSNRIPGEFAANGFPNTLKHERGVISMARSTSYNSARSQFFIMHENNPKLNGGYAAFGKVIYGMETVDAIAAVPTDPDTDRPLKKVVMTSVDFVDVEKP